MGVSLFPFMVSNGVIFTFAGIEDGYTGAEILSSRGYETSLLSRAQADLKFTYVVSCQIYGQQKLKKTAEAADISLLMQRFVFHSFHLIFLS